MRTIASFLLNALLLVQTALSNFISFYGVKPDLPLVFYIRYSQRQKRSPNRSAKWCCRRRPFRQIFRSKCHSKVYYGYIIGYTSPGPYKGRVIITMSMTFIGSVVFNLLYLLIAFLLVSQANSGTNFLTIAIPSALLNMIISPLFYFVFFKL